MYYKPIVSSTFSRVTAANDYKGLLCFRMIFLVKKMAQSAPSLLTILLCCFAFQGPAALARIVPKCETVKELANAGISKSYHPVYVCVIKYSSNFNTSKIVGPGHKCSFSHGIFQINSLDWCSRYRPGGLCNARCDKFLDDDITDDIRCAIKIQAKEGYKHWKIFERNCKGQKKLPKIDECYRKPYFTEEELERLNEESGEFLDDWADDEVDNSLDDSLDESSDESFGGSDEESIPSLFDILSNRKDPACF